MRLLLAMLIIGALVAGCAPAPADEEPLPAETASPGPAAAPTSTPAPTATLLPTSRPTRSAPTAQALTPVLPATSAAGPGAVPDDILNPILDDAAARSGVPRSQLVITRAEAVTWSDGSLGCPEPDQAYIQVLIEGYWVVISAGDAVYDYRADSGGYFKLCGSGLSGSVEVPPGGVLPVETVEPEDR